ncbi:MAG: ABC transporter permease [Anaerolineae bacterium]|nr:ABC transporter permease [Anaerolineae bacterium]
MLNSLRHKLIGDLKANRGAFLAVWLTFTIGMVFYNSTYPAGGNFKNLLRGLNERTHLADLWYDIDLAPPAAVDAARAAAGVARVSGRLVFEVGLEQKEAETESLVTLRVISMPESEEDVNNIVIQEGRAPEDAGEIVLMRAFARRHDIRVGDVLRLAGGIAGTPWEVEVVGLFSSAEYLIASRGPLSPFPTLSTFGVAYMPYDALAARYDAAGQVNSVVLTAADGADLTAVRAAVTEALQPYGIQLIMDRLQQPAVATLAANASANTQIALVFSLIFLFGSGAVMAVLMARQVESERRLIGTMRAMGSTRGEVLGYYLAFALIVAVTGALVGAPIGYLITYPVLDFFQSGMVGTELPFFSNPPQLGFMLVGAAAGLVMAWVAAAVPAWRAATTDPGLALRPPTPSGAGGLARARMAFLPRTGRQALRNLLRVPGRTLGTVLGATAGMAIIVISFAVWDLLDFNFTHYYNTNAYDFVVTVAEPVLHDVLLRQVEGVEGVTGVETGLILPVTVELADRTYTALGVALADDREFITFETIEGAPAFSDKQGVWLGNNLERALGARVGDTLQVTVQGQSATVTVQGIVKQVLGAPMYVPMSLLQEWTPLGVRPANQAYVRVDPARRVDVQRELSGLPGVIGVADWPVTTQDIQRAADFEGEFAYIFLGFGMFLTFVVMFNSINASMRERRHELAVMRTQGVSMGEVVRLVTWETMLATGAGLILGVLPSYWLVQYVTQLYDTDVAGNVFVIYPQTWVAAVVILVAIALVSQMPPLRGVRTINLGDVSKSVNV